LNLHRNLDTTVGEVLRLKSEDMDSNRMLIHIKSYKGRCRKDRYTLLSEKELIFSENIEKNISHQNGYLKEQRRGGTFL